MKYKDAAILKTVLAKEIRCRVEMDTDQYGDWIVSMSFNKGMSGNDVLTLQRLLKQHDIDFGKVMFIPIPRSNWYDYIEVCIR